MNDDEPPTNEIKKVVNESVDISEDVELKELIEKDRILQEKDRDLQKHIEYIDKKRREQFELLQKKITDVLIES